VDRTMSADARISELEAHNQKLEDQVATLKTQLEVLQQMQQMLADFVLPPELLRASEQGKTDMVEKLVAAGAKTDATNEVRGWVTCTCTRARCFARFQQPWAPGCRVSIGICMTCACHALPLPTL